jgi:hypothetical protein
VTWQLLLIGLAVLAYKAFRVWRKPYKVHRFCGGKGLDPGCDYSGKVLRFGARWVRPGLRKEGK